MKEGKKTHLSIVVFVRSDKIEVKYYNENTYFDKKKNKKKNRYNHTDDCILFVLPARILRSCHERNTKQSA